MINRKEHRKTNKKYIEREIFLNENIDDMNKIFFWLNDERMKQINILSDSNMSIISTRKNNIYKTSFILDGHDAVSYLYLLMTDLYIINERIFDIYHKIFFNNKNNINYLSYYISSPCVKIDTENFNNVDEIYIDDIIKDKSIVLNIYKKLIIEFDYIMITNDCYLCCNDLMKESNIYTFIKNEKIFLINVKYKKLKEKINMFYSDVKDNDIIMKDKKYILKYETK